MRPAQLELACCFQASVTAWSIEMEGSAVRAQRHEECFRGLAIAF